ncbi:MAG: putative two-component sensor histidine kinase protein [Actinomycetia bacterium]|nr:putative two-component sensor histidine kinase protein [Actinomycetes bacterium]
MGYPGAVAAHQDDLRDAGDRHLVAFYDTDGYLTDGVVRFVRKALIDGDAALVVATAAHRRQFAAALEDGGLDTATAIHEGRLVLLDAETTIQGFLVDGAPDRTLFRGSMAALITAAADGHRQVRVYGEMVALLWAWGNAAAAIALEDLWNELAGDHPFSLLCAYPLHDVASGDSEAFLTVCRQHSVVLPNEGFRGGAEWEGRRHAVLETGSLVGPAVGDDGAEGEGTGFVMTVVEQIRTGIIDRGNELLEDARRTIDAIDALVTPDGAAELVE